MAGVFASLPEGEKRRQEKTKKHGQSKVQVHWGNLRSVLRVAINGYHEERRAATGTSVRIKTRSGEGAGWVDLQKLRPPLSSHVELVGMRGIKCLGKNQMNYGDINGESKWRVLGEHDSPSQTARRWLCQVGHWRSHNTAAFRVQPTKRC